MKDNDQCEEALFDAARRLTDPRARDAMLDAACGRDAALRQRVEGLLAAQAEAEELFRPLPTPAGAPARPTGMEAASTEGPGTMVGRYRLLEKIGEGGFGVVYLAEQREPVKRRVALKVLKPGMDSRQVVARFEAERQALALMDHPNIAKVFDGGVTDAGRPYFVLELVRGLPITRYCDDHELPPSERLALFVQACQAVQHAHQKGIIHRDLKPSNILVTVNDGQAVPKVIDFGVAKALQQELTEKTLFTQFHHFIGTPAYMSPEQADLTSVDVDTRSDIYSLGVLLYELLTGRTPFDGRDLLASGLDAMCRTIREREPPRPSARLGMLAETDRTTAARQRQAQPLQLVRLLRGDLDWVVMKCLEKDRRRRYETANGLAADLQRHLACEPVVARPPSRLYEFQKTVRRHRVGFGATAAVLAALLIGGGVTGWALFREREARREADERLRVALGFVNQVITNVAPRIENLIGVAAAQESIGEASLAFVDQLRLTRGDDPALQATLVRALVHLSNAQNPGAPNTVGNYPKGSTCAREAIELLGRPTPELTETERLRLEFRARFGLVQCLYGLGQWEDGVARSGEIEPVLDQLERLPAERQSALRHRWNVRGNAAYSLLLVGRREEAIERLNGILASEWALSRPTNAWTGELEVLAHTRGNLACAHGLGNEFEVMLPLTEQATNLWERIVGLEPTSPRWQAGRAAGWAVRGWALMGSGRAGDGLAILELAQREIARLVKADQANDTFLSTRAVIAATRVLAVAAWSQDPAVSLAERRDRVGRAETELLQAEQFCRMAHAKEPEAWLAFGRAGVAYARTRLQPGSPLDGP